MTAGSAVLQAPWVLVALAEPVEPQVSVVPQVPLAQVPLVELLA